MAGFEAGFAKWMSETELKVLRSYRALAKGIYTYIVVNTPEFTGTTAASWKFGVNNIEGSGANYYRVEQTPYSLVSPNAGAILQGLSEGARGVQDLLSLKDVVYISNPNVFEREPLPSGFSSEYVAASIEDSSSAGWLRAVNRPGEYPVKTAVSFMLSKPVFSGLLV